MTFTRTTRARLSTNDLYLLAFAFFIAGQQVESLLIGHEGQSWTKITMTVVAIILASWVWWLTHRTLSNRSHD